MAESDPPLSFLSLVIGDRRFEVSRIKSSGNSFVNTDDVLRMTSCDLSFSKGGEFRGVLVLIIFISLLGLQGDSLHIGDILSSK